MTPAQRLAAWNRDQDRARAAYRAQPVTPKSAKCSGCDRRTTHRSGTCRTCRKAGQ